MNADIVIDLGMGKSGKSDKHKYGRVSREVDWSDESSIQDYFDSIGEGGTIMGFETSSYAQCTVDEDCEFAARNCRIGCGNREEVIPSY